VSLQYILTEPLGHRDALTEARALRRPSYIYQAVLFFLLPSSGSTNFYKLLERVSARQPPAPFVSVGSLLFASLWFLRCTEVSGGACAGRRLFTWDCHLHMCSNSFYTLADERLTSTSRTSELAQPTTLELSATRFSPHLFLKHRGDSCCLRRPPTGCTPPQEFLSVFSPFLQRPEIRRRPGKRFAHTPPPSLHGTSTTSTARLPLSEAPALFFFKQPFHLVWEPPPPLRLPEFFVEDRSPFIFFLFFFPILLAVAQATERRDVPSAFCYPDLLISAD